MDVEIFVSSGLAEFLHRYCLYDVKFYVQSVRLRAPNHIRHPGFYQNQLPILLILLFDPASNSLLEAVVFAHRAAQHTVSILPGLKIKKGVPKWNDEGTSHPEEMILITQGFKELQQIMTNYVGIVRSNLRLKRALDRLNIIYNETEVLFEKSTVSQKLCELRNAINVAYIIIKMAKERRESRGLHYNIDYPEKYKVLD